jgi:hypothetical protein
MGGAQMGEAHVIFRDGTTGNPAVLRALWEIENMREKVTVVRTASSPGYRIEIAGRPAADDFLSFAQRIFLLQHREEVEKLLAYEADDSHLTGIPVLG